MLVDIGVDSFRPDIHYLEVSKLVKISSFVTVYDNDQDHLALYHSIKLLPVFVEKSQSNFIKSLQCGVDENLLTQEEKNIVDDLIKIGFIANQSVEECDLLEIRQHLKPDLSVMYLILTDKCNLKCKYCFIEAGFSEDYQCKDMEWEVAQKALDYFSKNRNHNLECQVWFYGGEPFINSKLLFKCLDYLKENDPEVNQMIISNGTLITKEIAFKLKDYPKLQISVSLDGPKEINDQMRIDKNGHGSYHRIIHGIENLKAAGLRFGVSCTLGEHNVDQVMSIAEWIKDYIKTPHIGMNLMVDTPRQFVDEDYISRASKGLIDFFDKYRNEEVYESRILRKVTAFVKCNPRWHDCAACGKQIVIAPDGQIGICHEGLGEKKFFIGDIHKDFDFYASLQIQEWASRSPANMLECRDCAALGTCGGGCPYGAMLRYGSMWDVDKRFCVHSKETLEWLIWDLYDKMMSRLY